MGTLIIKNVDIDELAHNIRVCDTISVMKVMKSWLTEYDKKSLGTIENQKAKLRQMDIDWSNHSIVMVHQCPVCGYQGGHDHCPECNVLMLPVENVK